MNLVIVESPAKSKTISKYLGKDFKILASFGHTRDLPSKEGSVDPNNNFAMNYEIKTASKKVVAEIVAAAKASDKIYIASDPDREGEAIAWNVHEILKEKKIKSPIVRSVFNEITETAVKNSIKNARDIDINLVHAQQSRLSLDYLVGFNLSPVLWKKLPNSRSAGRVQSVALRLIVDREAEIRAFVPTEYYSLNFLVKTVNGDEIEVRLVEYTGKKISNKFPDKRELAEEIKRILENQGTLIVDNIESKDAKRSPFAPFNTASLQQDASNKLGFSVDRTMKTAQKLYEGMDVGSGTQGLITYMRTDGTTLSNDALGEIRRYIEKDFGGEYLSKSPRIYKTKTKNAQEAHEAIRPTSVTNTPEKVEKYLSKDEFALYSLIWKRAVACQMTEAIFLRQSIDFIDADKKTRSRANGNVLKFDGFLKVYNASFDEDGAGGILPKLDVKDNVDIIKPIEVKQHFTSPKARYTEASLVQEMESLGIGRPSTYGAIINILQERSYVYINKRQFFPNPNGVVVVMFLKSFFSDYIEYEYTAKLEDELDLISDGKLDKLDFLNNFWKKFKGKTDDAMATELLVVSEKVSNLMNDYIFSGNFKNIKKCTHCESENVDIKIGKFGVYIACNACEKNSNIDQYIDSKIDESGKVEIKKVEQSESVGKGENGEEIYTKSGKFGPYFETKDDAGNVKRASIPASIKSRDLNTALFLLSLPKKIGNHDGDDVSIGIGKFGPYVLYQKKYTSIPKDVEVMSVDLEAAISIINNKPEKSEKSSTREKKTIDIGKHPDTKKDIKVGKSKYGVYALYQKKFYTIEGIENPEDATLEVCVNAIKK